MRDVIRLASHAFHYLVVYDKHTRVPLYLGRTRRLASPGQRIVLHTGNRGRTTLYSTRATMSYAWPNAANR